MTPLAGASHLVSARAQGTARCYVGGFDGDDVVLLKEDHGATVSVYPYSWEVYRYSLEDEAVVAEPAGTFTQYPFRLAWGITIHKSQGKTFDKVVIDLGRGAFAAGQLYVALSRCTSLGGITLKTPIRASDVRTDPRIIAYMGQDISAIEDGRLAGIVSIIQQAIREGAALDLAYLKADDTEVAQTVQPLSVGPASYQGETYYGMKATDLASGAQRLFRIDRILQITKAERQKIA